jgi:hypothetical protein
MVALPGKHILAVSYLKDAGYKYGNHNNRGKLIVMDGCFIKKEKSIKDKNRTQ